MRNVALLARKRAAALFALKLCPGIHYPVEWKWSIHTLYLVSVLDVEMTVRTEQSNVSSRHDGADYMGQDGGKVG
jgi:hypothetical protein